MGLSELPPPPSVDPGNDSPLLRCRPPGPQSRTWRTRMGHLQAPMGSRPSAPGGGGAIVLTSGQGSNVLDVDGNRYVDLAAGFGALLLGHGSPQVRRAVELQSARLFQALGDVYPSDAKIGLLSRLAELLPDTHVQSILAQSGSDAVSAALKTAALVTGKPGIVAFEGAYHGLGYGPLGALGLRASYREPFQAQLNPHVAFAPYPSRPAELDAALSMVRTALGAQPIGAILVEPVLGRGGVIVPPRGFLPALKRLAQDHGALLIADEIWTGLGRTGKWICSMTEDCVPDLVCLGKGLGGGLPLSACLGPAALMQAWSQEAEVVHTATFAGAPLACASALATLDVLHRHRLVETSAIVGERWLSELRDHLEPLGLEVRGMGLMAGVDVSHLPGGASRLQQSLLERGYITSTGGGARSVLVLTPPLNISESLLLAFTSELARAVREQG